MWRGASGDVYAERTVFDVTTRLPSGENCARVVGLCDPAVVVAFLAIYRNARAGSARTETSGGRKELD